MPSASDNSRAVVARLNAIAASLRAARVSEQALQTRQLDAVRRMEAALDRLEPPRPRLTLVKAADTETRLMVPVETFSHVAKDENA